MFAFSIYAFVSVVAVALVNWSNKFFSLLHIFTMLHLVSLQSLLFCCFTLFLCVCLMLQFF